MSHRCETSALRLPTCPARTAHLPQIARCLAQSRSAPRVSQMSLLSARRHHIISRSIGLAPAACKYRRSKVLACPIQYSHGPSFCSEGEVGYTWRDMASMPKIQGWNSAASQWEAKAAYTVPLNSVSPGRCQCCEASKVTVPCLPKSTEAARGCEGEENLSLPEVRSSARILHTAHLACRCICQMDCLKAAQAMPRALCVITLGMSEDSMVAKIAVDASGIRLGQFFRL